MFDFKKSKISAQIALEFLVIYSFVMIVFIILFALVINQRASTLTQQQYAYLQLVAQDAAGYLNQAAAAGSGYSATLQLPSAIGATPYNLSLSSSGVVLASMKIGDEVLTTQAFSTVRNLVVGGSPSSGSGSTALYQIPVSSGRIYLSNSGGTVYVDSSGTSATTADRITAEQLSSVTVGSFSGPSTQSEFPPTFSPNFAKYVSVPLQWPQGQTITVVAWVYFNNVPKINAGIVSAMSSLTYGTISVFPNGNCQLQVGVTTTVWQATDSNYCILPHKWYQIIAWANQSSGKYGLYINGVSNFTEPFTGSLETASSFDIGLFPYQNSFLPGYISDVQIYNRTLSQQEVTTLYNEGLNGTPVSGGLAGWWPLAGNTNDYSGNGNQGSSHGLQYSTVSKIGIHVTDSTSGAPVPSAMVALVASTGSFELTGINTATTFTNSNGNATLYLTNPINNKKVLNNLTMTVFNGNYSVLGNLSAWFPLDLGYGNMTYAFTRRNYLSGGTSWGVTAWTPASSSVMLLPYGWVAASPTFPENISVEQYGSWTNFLVNGHSDWASGAIGWNFGTYPSYYNDYLGISPSTFPSSLNDLGNGYVPCSSPYQSQGYSAVSYVNMSGDVNFTIVTDDAMEVFYKPISLATTHGDWLSVFGGAAWKGQGATEYTRTINISSGEYEVAVDWTNICYPGTSVLKMSSFSNGEFYSHSWGFNGNNVTSSAVARFPGNPLSTVNSTTSTGWITIPPSPTLNNIPRNGSFTVSAWVLYDGPTPTHSQGVFGDYPIGGGPGFQLMGYGGLDVLYINGSAVPWPGPDSLPAHRWELVTAQYDSKTGVANVYLNGTLFASDTLPKGLYLLQHLPYNIGNDAWESGGYDTFNGTISNVQLYASFLTPSQVSSLYNGGTAGVPLTNSKLVGWWPLNGNANDYSGNGNNGTIHYNVTFPTSGLIPFSLDSFNRSLNLNGPYTNNWAVTAWTPSTDIPLPAYGWISADPAAPQNVTAEQYGYFGEYLASSGNMGWNFGTPTAVFTPHFGINPLTFPSSVSDLNNYVSCSSPWNSQGYTASKYVYLSGYENFTIFSDDGSAVFYRPATSNVWSSVFGSFYWGPGGGGGGAKSVYFKPGLYEIVVDWVNLCGPGASAFKISAPSAKSSPYFNGQTGYISDNAISPTSLPTGSVATITAWVKPSQIQTDCHHYCGVVSYGARACTGTSLLLSIQSNGLPSMATWCNDFVPSTGPTLTWNSWNFEAVRVVGTSVTLYVNGKYVNGTLGAGVVPNFQSEFLAIGSTDNRAGGRILNGSIKDVQIYDSALSLQQLGEMYGAGLPASVKLNIST